MRKNRLLEFIERVWNDGDVEAGAEFIGPAYAIHHDPGDPGEGQTLDLAGFKDRVRKSRAPVPDQRFAIQEIYENESSVAIMWLWQGTHTGDIAGFPVTGKTLHMSGATVYTFEGDRITGYWQIADRLAIFRQLQSASK